MTAEAIQTHEQSLTGPLVWSIMFHSVLFGSLAVSTLVSHRGDNWGGSAGGGGAISVKLVGGQQAIPLPIPEVVTENRVADETKGLYKAEPPPKVKEPPAEAKEIPQFTKEKQPRYVTRPSKTLENNAPPPPPNAVPYGQGGSPAVPYTQFTLGAGSGTNAGMGFTGEGGGDFGGRYSWYVDAVRNRVSSNWLQSTVDPSVRFAPRAVVTFDILRNGAITNVQVLQSSGNASVDSSAVRAIVGSSPVNPLPPGYTGPKVSVEFWFDFKR
jgi:TonB family protein